MKPLVLLLLALTVSPSGGWAGAQGSGNCEPGWLPTFGSFGGTNDSVEALAVFDDRSGSGEALYAGGSFSNAGGALAMRIAKWDGTNWSALGSGLNGTVHALAVFDDGSGSALYAGGTFTIAGGTPAMRVARWDGANWSAVGPGMSGGLPPSVEALAVFDDGNGAGPALYAGGTFSSAGKASANNIAKWDGTSWTALGSGLGGSVRALEVFDDGNGPVLCAGGGFGTAGGVPAERLAQWDGSAWSALGSGIVNAFSLNTVLSMTVFDDGSGSGPALCAAGTSNLSGVPANIIQWNGSTWSPLGGALTWVYALTVFDDGSGQGPALHAGGYSYNSGAAYVVKLDGPNWSTVGGNEINAFNVNGVRAMAVLDDGSGRGPALCVAGRPAFPGLGTGNVASWNGSTWSALGNGLSDQINAMAAFDDGSGSALHAAGSFRVAGGAIVNYIAKWGGATTWSPLGGGMNGFVDALTIFDDGKGPALYAGGGFTQAGGVPANRVAKWDGTEWSPLGDGTNNSIGALTVFDDGSGPALYAAGRFLSAGGVAANRIAKWDGTEWSSLASGLTGGSVFIRALAVYDDGSGPALYAAGKFDFAGGVPARNIARWNGTEWSPLGSGLVGGVFFGPFVNALAVFDDGSPGGPALYAGGDFALAGGAPARFIARWDGTSWTSVGAGLTNGSVNALTVFDDGSGPALVAGGNFASAGGLPAKSIAMWGGPRSGWSALGSNMNAGVTALTVFDDLSGGGPALFAGGPFTASAGGDSYLARWGCPAPPPFITFCTPKTTTVCGPANIDASGSPSATATSGFTIEAQPVRGCRAGLLLYSNQPTVTGAPFGGPGDGALCLAAPGLRRAGPIQSGSSPNLCDGTLAIDINRFRALTWTASGCNPPPGQTSPAGFLGNIGTTVNAQMWGRDSITTGQVLSDGITWSIGP